MEQDNLLADESASLKSELKRVTEERDVAVRRMEFLARRLANVVAALELLDEFRMMSLRYDWVELDAKNKVIRCRRCGIDAFYVDVEQANRFNDYHERCKP